MLLRWVGVAFVFEQREDADEFGSSLCRLDHFVDEAALGGDERGSSPTVREGVVLSHHQSHRNGSMSSVKSDDAPSLTVGLLPRLIIVKPEQFITLSE